MDFLPFFRQNKKDAKIYKIRWDETSRNLFDKILDEWDDINHVEILR